MRETETLIIGGGVTGLSIAALLGRDADCVLLEREAELGGYCRTVERDGFVWDCSGHFFHFREPRVEQWLRARMQGEEVRTIRKRAFVWYADRLIDFPFQKNVHQLPQQEFLECLADLHEAERARPTRPPGNFEEMLFARYGRAISEKFLIPYNEKLYATALSLLDVDAMGRFFPHVTLDAVLRNIRQRENTSYNDSFTYPARGAQSYVRALASELRPEAIRTSEPVTAIDLATKTVTTPRETYHFGRLVSSLPFPQLLRLIGREQEATPLSWNQVLVFNLGFDRKGPTEPHWIYFPQRELPFYRVGFYDNIFESDRMSLYVELGFPSDAKSAPAELLPRVLEGLERARIVAGQTLVAWHSVVLNPAYVHIDRSSTALYERVARELKTRDVFSLGRYGRWTYCSIEDNMLEAEAWVAHHAGPSARGFR